MVMLNWLFSRASSPFGSIVKLVRSMVSRRVCKSRQRGRESERESRTVAYCVTECVVLNKGRLHYVLARRCQRRRAAVGLRRWSGRRAVGGGGGGGGGGEAGAGGGWRGGRGGGRHHGSRAGGGRRYGQARPQKKKRMPKPPSRKALMKDIRKSCDNRGIGSAAVLSSLDRAKQFGARLDASVFQTVLEALAGIGGRAVVDEMRAVVELREHGVVLSPAGVHKIVLALPQCQSVDAIASAEIVDILVGASNFQAGPHAKEYYRTRARWCVLEFFGEAAGVLEGIEKYDPSQLARMGKCIFGASVEKAKKKNECVFRNGNSGGGLARREISTGDSVRVTQYEAGHRAETAATAAYDSAVADDSSSSPKESVWEGES